MILGVKPIHKTVNCFEDQVISLASWLNSGYELMYAKSWTFGFIPAVSTSQNTIGERIELVESDMFNLLRRYHGIQLVIHQDCTAGEILDIIMVELSEERPVIFSIDVFHCPWAPNYRQRHSGHACVAVGLDKNLSEIYCMDGYYMIHCEPLPMENFKQGCTKLLTYSVVEKEKNIDWRQIVEAAVFQINGSGNPDNSFDAMRSFGNEIAQSLDLEAESSGYLEIWEPPLFVKLTGISDRRKLFASSLRYLAGECNVDDLTIAAKKLEEAANDWYTVYGMLVKMKLSGTTDRSKQNIADRIRRIADKEQIIADELLQICRNKSINTIYVNSEFNNKPALNGQKPPAGSCDITFVNISEYFNNNGFGSSISNSCTADLTGNRQYFLADKLPEERIWNTGGVTFLFPELADTLNDNISCQEQSIYVPEGQYSAIFLLGTSEWGSYSENMTVHYKDGETEKVILEFSDNYKDPIYGEKVAWIGTGVAKRNNNSQPLTYPVRLYIQSCTLKYRGAVESITLPYCPNIHIFALSLEVNR